MSTVERQHELEQNALAEWIVQLLDVIRPYVVTIIGGAVAIVAAVVAWLVIASTNAATEASSWEAYLGALATGDTMAFNDVVARYPESDAALWSQLVLADMALTDGAVLAFEDRTASNERLESAAALYNAVLAAGPDGLLEERATFGLAKANESLGKLDEAQSGYASVASNFPESPLAVVAQEHAEALAEGGAKGWYDWFFAQDLRPAAGASAAEAAGATDGGDAADDPNASLFEEGPVGDAAETTSEPADASETTAPAEPAGTP